jgi:hypothetical protein
MVPGHDILFSAALCPLLSLRRMNEPRYTDTCQVQHDHGRGEDAHVHDVGSRRNDRGDDEDHQD